MDLFTTVLLGVAIASSVMLLFSVRPGRQHGVITINKKDQHSGEFNLVIFDGVHTLENQRYITLKVVHMDQPSQDKHSL